MEGEINQQVAGMMAGVMGIITLVTWIYFGVCFMMMAKKTATPNGWLAFVPIVNVFLILKIANKPMWWFLLFLIPLVNVVISILVFMEIAKRLGKPDWIGVLMIVPVVNLFVPAYLAFSK
jgi:hypothetical protein